MFRRVPDALRCASESAASLAAAEERECGVVGGDAVSGNRFHSEPTPSGDESLYGRRNSNTGRSRGGLPPQFIAGKKNGVAGRYPGR